MKCFKDRGLRHLGNNSIRVSRIVAGGPSGSEGKTSQKHEKIGLEGHDVLLGIYSGFAQADLWVEMGY